MARELVLDGTHLLALAFEDAQVVLLLLNVLDLLDFFLLKLVDNLLLQVLLRHYYVLEILIYVPAACLWIV